MDCQSNADGSCTTILGFGQEGRHIVKPVAELVPFASASSQIEAGTFDSDSLRHHGLLNDNVVLGHVVI